MERKKIDEMKLPEKLTYSLPTSDASSMKIFAKLLSGNFETLLETEQLRVNLSLVSTVSSFNCTCYACWLTISKRHPVIICRRLRLPVHTRDKHMFCWPIKIKSFDSQTSKFTHPLGNVLAPLTQTLEGRQSQQRVRAFCLL